MKIILKGKTRISRSKEIFTKISIVVKKEIGIDNNEKANPIQHSLEQTISALMIKLSERVSFLNMLSTGTILRNLELFLPLKNPLLKFSAKYAKPMLKKILIIKGSFSNIEFISSSPFSRDWHIYRIGYGRCKSKADANTHSVDISPKLPSCI